MPEPAASVEAYVAGFPEDVQEILGEVRAAIRRGLPGRPERIRYGMPAVMLDDRHALHFAGWKKHIGLYPVTRLEGALEAEIEPYRAKKDSVNFPYAKPIPYDLIERLAAALREVRTA